LLTSICKANQPGNGGSWLTLVFSIAVRGIDYEHRFTKHEPEEI